MLFSSAECTIASKVRADSNTSSVSKLLSIRSFHDLNVDVSRGVIRAGCAMMLVNVCVLLLATPASAPVLARLQLHLHDSGYIAAVTLLVLGGIRLRTLIGIRLKFWTSVLVLAVAWFGVLSAILFQDLQAFTERQLGNSGNALALHLAVSAACGASFAVLWKIAIATGTTRVAPLATIAAIVLAIANHRLLPGDYPGVHAMAALCAGLVLAGALSGWPERGFTPQRLRLPTTVLWAALAVHAVVVRPSSTVSSLLAQHEGSVLAPFLDAFRAVDTGDDRHLLGEGEWFVPRGTLESIAATLPPIVGQSPVVILVTIDAFRADGDRSPTRA